MSNGTIELAIHNPHGSPYRREVKAHIYGAWAAHESTTGLGYRVSFVRFGMAVPYEFPTLSTARAAAKAINAMRDDWPSLEWPAIKAEGETIKAICAAKKGEKSSGPKCEPVPISEIQAAE